MLIRKRRRRQRLLQLTAMRHKLRTRGLTVARVVPRHALQRGSAAIPAPGYAKARKRLGLHRLLQFGARPGFAAIRRYIDARDAPFAGKRDTGNFIHTRPAHLQTE